MHIVTFCSRYSMLKDKLEGLHTNFDTLASVSTATPQALARTRGKALHYECAIQYLRPACASLTQAMHQAEQADASPPPEAAQEGNDPDFQWDQTLTVTTRTRAAVACLQLALHRFGTLGQPLWPIPPASLYGRHLADAASPDAPTVLTVFALPDGGGFSLRATGPAIIGHGRWTDAADLLQAEWMSPGPSAPNGAPHGFAHGHALACLLGLHTASQLVELSPRPLPIRCASEEALSALCRGALHCPALQDISMLFQTACMMRPIAQPAFLVTPDGLLTRPTPSNAR